MKKILIVFIIAIASIEYCAKVTADSILLAVVCKQLLLSFYRIW